jgi:hypothetical protein
MIFVPFDKKKNKKRILYYPPPLNMNEYFQKKMEIDQKL